MTKPETVQAVIDVVVETLGIEERRDEFNASTPLFGDLPELDSLGVLELVTSLESRFDFELEDDEFDGAIFESVSTLADFVEAKLP